MGPPGNEPLPVTVLVEVESKVNGKRIRGVINNNCGPVISCRIKT